MPPPLVRIGVVSTPDGKNRVILAKVLPSPRELSVLYALSEHIGHVISMNDMCHRLKVTPNTIRIAACRLRQKLVQEWVIRSERNHGLSLIYIGGSLAKAKETTLTFDPLIFKFNRSRAKSKAKLEA